MDRLYGVPAHEKTPLVIASAGGYPKDLNFYQTIKTLCNALEVSQEGGHHHSGDQVRRGLRQRGYPPSHRGLSQHAGAGEALRADFSIGAFIGYLFAQTGESRNLIAVTDIPQEQFGTARIHTVKTLDEALALSRSLNGGQDLRVTLLPHGANTLPKLG